ncbi:TRM13 domain-containing protein/zf-U11-48K domain-containing protein/zf-TRM13_CCCH domain-containing protein [Cephalotus follicularis]|uniref:tRNA:m(4)X modification enzyme TRM13 n=1 Tax=Cephalotus follicularis TaxID=3775 RepID=A0A1Q3B7Q4_CEPFO|nr:TRM13 domain-containing protein/zf-U11-48K domain-containing protein/zf-TRM13_CCCH domain-containing protein [Cephalotus follicularis]
MEKRCKFWIHKKSRFCANARLGDSLYCGNHNQRHDGQWVPCPIDPSHVVLRENLGGHVKRCPMLKQAQILSLQPFYQKGINAGKEEEEQTPLDYVTSEMKRNAVYNMSVTEFCNLIKKIKSVHDSWCKDIRDSYKAPEACNIWIKREVDRKLPFQKKHVVQQASILGNLEEFGVLNDPVGKEQCEGKGFSGENGNSNGVPAVVEFGAGRGYLTQMLADCYEIKRVLLVERKSYKLKADRSLRQKGGLILERLRINIEDLNLSAVESLREIPYLAIGKHLCGPATDLTLRCCLGEQYSIDNTEKFSGNHYLKGIAVATCCHHLCQWKHYINKNYLSNLGFTKEEFHAITWFTSWAVDADHGSDLSEAMDCSLHLQSTDGDAISGEDIARDMIAIERAALGFMCKQIIDMGRLIWVKERGLDTQLVKYCPPSVSPENHLLIARNHIL